MKKILIADDDTVLAEMYKTQFVYAGFSVITAVDGEEAIKKAKSDTPDLILLDVLMPKKDGIEALADLKADPKTKDIPVIFLTNLGGRVEDTKAAREMGAEDLIVKSSVVPKEVIAKVKEVLAR